MKLASQAAFVVIGFSFSTPRRDRQVHRLVVARRDGEVGRARVVEGREDDGDAPVLAHGRPRHLKLAEDALRKRQFPDEIEVPVLLRRVEERRRRGIGVLVDDLPGQAVVEVLRHHQEVRRTLELLGMLLLERPELVDGVEARLLDADTPVEIGKGEDLALDLRIRPRRARVAVGDRVAAPVAVLVEKDEVDAPGVDADGGDLSLRHRLIDAGLDRRDEFFDVPAVMPFLPDLRILKAVNLLKRDLSALHRPEDVAPRRRTDVNRKIAFHLLDYIIILSDLSENPVRVQPEFRFCESA